MADAASPAEPKDAAADGKAEVKAAKPLRKPNPMWKYLGFGENFRPRIPSRNWLIFLSITGSFAAAVIYDKREKRRVQRKWCKLVEHVAKEPLDPRAMPRKLTIFLEGPPTDGLRVAQDHFKEYVKPVLVASGLDWEFIQGRKEGDVRAELAEKIRWGRTPPHLRTKEEPTAEMRSRNGIKEFDGPNGDIVIGRHTWKEYVRGLHEGWLGPLTEAQNSTPEADAESLLMETESGTTTHSSPPEIEKSATETSSTPDDKPKKPPQPQPFISTAEYKTAPDPADIPSELDPSTTISFPHILGIRHTPLRLYRFLNRRALADSIGRETAAVVLCTHRPYTTTSADTSSSSSFASDSPSNSDIFSPEQSEQGAALKEEEFNWHKAARVRVDGEKERIWLEPMVLDPRIASRMRRFELTAEDEDRARSIVVREEEIEGWIKGGLRSLGRRGLKAVGLGNEKKKEVDEQFEE